MPRIIPEYKEEVRKKIIGIAYQLFLSRGYRGTTMEDIAGALGVTKPALYQYFPGKEDLYAAVAEHGRQELRGILERSYQNRDILRGSAGTLRCHVPVCPPVPGHVFRDDAHRAPQ